MFERCDWTKYLINIPKRSYQSNNTCALTFVLIFFFSSCNHSIYILIATRLLSFKQKKICQVLGCKPTPLLKNEFLQRDSSNPLCGDSAQWYIFLKRRGNPWKLTVKKIQLAETETTILSCSEKLCENPVQQTYWL